MRVVGEKNIMPFLVDVDALKMAKVGHGEVGEYGVNEVQVGEWVE